jgi:uncharacterized protein (DUF2141 family)
MNSTMARLMITALTAFAGSGLAEAAQLTVQVEGAEPRQGTVLIGVCSRSLDFSSCGLSQSVQQPDSSLVVVFPDIPEGAYAIAAFQDLNGNGNLDRDPRGLPREPYGFSNGTGRTAPPSFEAGRVVVQGNVVARVRLARSPLAK